MGTAGYGVYGSSNTTAGVYGFYPSAFSYGYLGGANHGVYGNNAAAYGGYFVGKGYFSDSLTVNDIIYSTSGGFKFPDSTTQTTAATGDNHSLDAADGNPNDVLYVDSDANIGIRTTTPYERLHIKQAATGKPVLLLEAASGSGADAHVRFFDSSEDYSYALGIDDTGNKLKIAYQADSTAAPGVGDLITVTDSGHVGIGTTDPSAKLHVNGNTHVDGNLTWQTKTGYISVAAGAFTPQEEIVCYWKSPGRLLLSPDTTASDAGFQAPVQLPHGATVTKITFYWHDSDPNECISLDLARTTMAGGWLTMGSAASTGSAGDGSSYDDSISDATIDNSQYGYVLHIEIPANFYELEAHSAFIEYTFTETY
jgi:hypothetical protein